MVDVCSRMQRAVGLLVVALLSLALVSIAGLAQPGEAQAATAGIKTIFDADFYSSSFTKTVSSYDINGDGKKDNLTFTLVPTDDPTIFRSMHIAINGKKVRTMKGMGYGHGGKAKLITLANGKRFLYAEFTGYNNYGDQAIMQYSKGKLKTICSNKSIKHETYGWIASMKPKGNAVKVTFEPVNRALGVWFTVDYTYKYKGGTLKRTSSTSTSFRYFSGSQKLGKGWLTNAAPLKIYKSKSCKTKKFTAKKNTRMKVTAIYVKSGILHYKVKTASGKTGWFKDKSFPVGDPHLSFNSTLFNETVLGG